MQGLGYLISIVSVLFLGLAAWPAPNEPDWLRLAILLGMTTSVLGMALRYLAHRQNRRDIKRAERKAESA